MGLWESYKMRWVRRRALFRALLRSRQLRCIKDRTENIKAGDIIIITTLRNEKIRLAYFLDYYRSLGVQHFLMIDNASTDGGGAYLADQSDVSVWQTDASYKASGFGIDWTNFLARRYARNHWTLTVDVDEFFVFPFCDTRPLRALTDWLDASGTRSFGAMLLDMYPKGPIGRYVYEEGQNPFNIAAWFDAGNYVYERNTRIRNLWIQGGPRARAFFADQPKAAPALNKTPLIKWQKPYVYISSTHSVLPRGLNQVYDQDGGEMACGVLLHAKFLNTFSEKVAEEATRGEHYSGSREYAAYSEGGEIDLWTRWSERYMNWRQLEILGLLSKGNWT